MNGRRSSVMGVCGEEWSVRGRKRWGRKDKVE
jgi:hypothetical protein